MNRSYHELIKIDSFRDRFEYLKLNGRVGQETFGLDRYLNQAFYRSKEWKSLRNRVIIRDNGCDLACPGYLIYGRVYIHHINPITAEQIESKDSCLFNLDNLVCVSYDTHQAIHYGDEHLIPEDPIIRKPNDTIPWK